MARQGDTADRILDVAEGLLQRRGYNGFAYKDVVQPFVQPHAVRRSTKDIRHGHGRRGRCRLPQGVVEHRAQVLLELGRPGPLDRPVAGVVGPHGQLVHDQVPVVGFEQLPKGPLDVPNLPSTILGGAGTPH